MNRMRPGGYEFTMDAEQGAKMKPCAMNPLQMKNGHIAA